MGRQGQDKGEEEENEPGEVDCSQAMTTLRNLDLDSEFNVVCGS